MVYGAIFFLLALSGALAALLGTIREHGDEILAALEGPRPSRLRAEVISMPLRRQAARFEPQHAAA